MIAWQYVACLAVGYLMGSIPVGYLVAKRTAKVDVREHGSGKTGMTNVLRTAGIRAAVIVITGDLVKGVLAVVFAGLIMGNSYLAVGVFGFGLLRSVGLCRLPAAAGGAMLLLLPYVHHELGVLMLVPLAGLLATLGSLVYFARRPSIAAGLVLGASVGATYLLCGQYGIFIALAIAPAAPWLLRRELWSLRAASGIAAAAFVCAVLVVPLAVKQIEVVAEHGFGRSQATALRSASYPSAWLATPWPQLFRLPGVEPVEEVWMQGHFPGTLKLLLALAGVAWGLRERTLRGFTALLVTAGVLASLWSALPRLELLGVSSYPSLASALPGLAQMRAWWRFIVVAQICVALLAALGIQALLTLGRARLGRWPVQGLLAVAGSVGLLAAVELWPPPQRLAPVPDLARWRPFGDWVREQVPADTPLLYLPFPASGGVSDYAETGRWMYLTALHGRPMVNGYSGFFPRPYLVLARALRGYPQRTSYLELDEVGLRLVVTRASWLRENPNCAPPPDVWERVLHLEDLDVEVWRVSDQGS